MPGRGSHRDKSQTAAGHLTPGLGTLPHSPQFRVLRLIMAAGAAAAGLCLVLAMLTLAASFGKANAGDSGNYHTGGTRPGTGSGQQNDLNGLNPPARQGNHGGTGTQRAKPGPGKPGPGKPVIGKGQAHSSSPGPRHGEPQPGQTVATYQGSGTADDGPFHIRQPGEWGVSWSFRCPAGRSEDFSVSEVAGHSGKTPPGKKGSSLQIDTSGPSASGLSWQAHDVGSHFLKIVSGCSWTIEVVLPRSG